MGDIVGYVIYIKLKKTSAKLDHKRLRTMYGGQAVMMSLLIAGGI